MDYYYYYFQVDSGNSSNINQKAQGKCLFHSILISINTK